MQPLSTVKCVMAPGQFFHATMQSCSCSTAIAGIEGEDAPRLQAGSPSEMVKTTCQATINELREAVQAELKQVWEDVNELHGKTTKILGYTLV